MGRPRAAKEKVPVRQQGAALGQVTDESGFANLLTRLSAQDAWALLPQTI